MLFRGVIQSSIASWLGLAWGSGARQPALRSVSPDFGHLHDHSGDTRRLSWLLVLSTNGNLLTCMIVHAVYDFRRARSKRPPFVQPLENADDS